MENDSESRTGLVIAGCALLAHGLLKPTSTGWISAAIGGALAFVALRPERTRSSDSVEAVTVQRTLTVAQDPAEAYASWRKLENFGPLLSRSESVEDLGANRHAWSVRGKLGLPVRWETEIVNDQPARLLEWQSIPGSPIRSSGSIRFKKKRGGRGTKLHIRITYFPAKGFSAAAFNAAIGSPAHPSSEPERMSA